MYITTDKSFHLVLIIHVFAFLHVGVMVTILLTFVTSGAHGNGKSTLHKVAAIFFFFFFFWLQLLILQLLLLLLFLLLLSFFLLFLLF